MKPQRARVMWISLALMGMVGLTAVPAGAVSLNPYTYNVDGQLSIMGNNVCAPSPCTETLNFSFLFEWVSIGTPTISLYEGAVVPGSSSVTSSGPLSPFALGEGLIGNIDFMGFGNGRNGDEIDMGPGLPPGFFVTNTPGTPSFASAERGDAVLPFA